MSDNMQYVYFEDYSELIVYPIYLRISINHKTTKLRSFTKYKLSEDEFEEYLKTGTYEFEKIGEKLYPETERIHRILDYFINMKKVDYKDYDIRTILTFYNRDFSSVYKYAFSIISRDLRDRYPTEDIGEIGFFLNKTINPKKSLDYFKKLGLDIYAVIDKLDVDFINLFDKFISFRSHLDDFKTIRLIDWYSGILVDKFRTFLADSKDSETTEYYISMLAALFNEMEELFEGSTKGKGNIEEFDYA
jgi:hypothetical protein